MFDDLDYLCDVLLMEHQILHPIWYHISDLDVSKWYPRMAMNTALRYPPETVDSIARKFQVKLAGKCDLRVISIYYIYIYTTNWYYEIWTLHTHLHYFHFCTHLFSLFLFSTPHPSPITTFALSLIIVNR